jgi:hypothetical protein
VQPQVFEYTQQYKTEDHQEPGQRNIYMVAHRLQK